MLLWTLFCSSVQLILLVSYHIIKFMIVSDFWLQNEINHNLLNVDNKRDERYSTHAKTPHTIIHNNNITPCL